MQRHDDCRGTSALTNIQSSLLRVFGRENLLRSSLSRGSALIAARVWERVHLLSFLPVVNMFCEKKKKVF